MHALLDVDRVRQAGQLPGTVAPPAAPAGPGPEAAAAEEPVGSLDDSLAGFVVPLAIAWTVVIAGYLAWSFLRRPDEERLLAALRASYRPPEPLVAAVGAEAAAPAGAPDPTPTPEDR